MPPRNGNRASAGDPPNKTIQRFSVRVLPCIVLCPESSKIDHVKSEPYVTVTRAVADPAIVPAPWHRMLNAFRPFATVTGGSDAPL
jgi:hypothetical protein